MCLSNEFVWVAARPSIHVGEGDIAEGDTEEDDNQAGDALNESLMATTNGHHKSHESTGDNAVDPGTEASPMLQGPDDNTPVPSAAAAVYDGAADAVELLATDPAPMVAFCTRKAMNASGHTLDIVMPELESAGSGGYRSSLQRHSHSHQVSSGQQHRTSAGSVASSQDQGSTQRRDPWHSFTKKVRLVCFRL